MSNMPNNLLFIFRAEKSSTAADDELVEHQREYRKRLESTLITGKADLKWDDVIGLSDAKAILNDAIVLPMLFGNDTGVNKIQPCNGVLLYGVNIRKNSKILQQYHCLYFSLQEPEKRIWPELLLLRLTLVSSL